MTGKTAIGVRRSTASSASSSSTGACSRRPRTRRAAARAPAVPVHRLHAISTSSSRSASRASRRRSSSARRRRARTACRPRRRSRSRSRERARARRRAVRPAERRAAARARAQPASASCGGATWNATQRDWMHDYFSREVVPVLTPLGLDPAHPFPRILNKSLNFVVELAGKDAFGRSSGVAIVQAPRSCRASIRLPPAIAGRRIRLRVPVLGPACPRRRAVRRHEGQGLLPVPRDAQQRSVRRRGRGRRTCASRCRASCRSGTSATRCGWRWSSKCPPTMIDFLLQQFELDEQRPLPGQRAGQPGSPDARCSTWSTARTSSTRRSRPRLPRAMKSATTICSRRSRSGDVLLHHPFQSFAPVIDFIAQAAARSRRARDQADAVPHRRGSPS